MPLTTFDCPVTNIPSVVSSSSGAPPVPVVRSLDTSARLSTAFTTTNALSLRALCQLVVARVGLRAEGGGFGTLWAPSLLSRLSLHEATGGTVTSTETVHRTDPAGKRDGSAADASQAPAD